MRPAFSILMDFNEKGSARAASLAKAVGGDPTYELAGFAELPVDMRMSMQTKCINFGMDKDCEPCYQGPCVSNSVVNIEFKEIPDFWQSKNTGHLGQQVLQMVAEGHPTFVAVFGSLQEVLESVPKMKSTVNQSGMTKPQRRSQMDIQTDISTCRAFCADATACGVPVFFLSTNHQQSFAWILSMAKNILTGPNLSSWLPRFPVEPRGYGVLCAIPGIGHETAKCLLECASIGAIMRMKEEALAELPINGKKLGPAKAHKLVEVLG